MDAEHRARLERTFDVAACEWLARAEQEYYSTHGNYVPPLAALVNETRADRDRLQERITHLLTTDPAEWEPEVIRWLSPTLRPGRSSDER